MIKTQVLVPRAGGQTEGSVGVPLPTKDARVVGGWILHPVALGSFALLGLNDHFFKQEFGSWWTGKLSDVAGMMGFPLFLLAALETARSVWGWLHEGRFRAFPLGSRDGAWAVLATGLIFALVNLSDLAGHLYVRSVETLWAPLVWMSWGLLSPPTVGHVVDPTDLLALPFLWVPWWVIRQVKRKASYRDISRSADVLPLHADGGRSDAPGVDQVPEHATNPCTP